MLKSMAVFLIGTLRLMESRTLPTVKQPPSHIQLLEDAIATLKNKYAITNIANDLTGLLEAINTALELTRFGDCLFSDELRNILMVKHHQKSLRGTEKDPLRGKRKCHRKRIR